METYKSAPTFTLDREYFEAAREQTMDMIMKNRFNLMAHGRTLLWIDEELAKFPEVKKEKLDNKIKELKDKRKAKI